MPLHTVQTRTLHASVWDSSQFQENMFLGRNLLIVFVSNPLYPGSVSLSLASIDLEAGLEAWHSLGQFSRL